MGSALKRIGENINKGLDTTDNTEIDNITLCKDDITKYTDLSAALEKNFYFCDFTAIQKTHIHIRGYSDFYGGYASHTREVIFRLDDTNKYCIKFTPIKSPVHIDPFTWNKLNYYIHNPIFEINKSKFICIAAPGYMQEKFLPSNGRIKIGWTMIETVGVQPQIVEWLKNLDIIFAPTCADCNKFNDAGFKNVYRVPLGYDELEYNLDVKPLNIGNLIDRYVFGVLGTWNIRKGIRDIVHAYCTEFNCDDPVSLLLCCKYGTRPYGSDKDKKERWSINYELNKVLEELKISKDKLPHICIMDVPIHPNIMPSLCARFDCLVGFSMGESTWLPGLELIGLGKPVIQLYNEFAGYMDYLRSNRYMCNENKTVKCDEELYEGTSEYYKGEEMVIGNYLELGENMRKVYSENGKRVQEANTRMLRSEIKNYTWNDAINILMDRLN